MGIKINNPPPPTHQKPLYENLESPLISNCKKAYVVFSQFCGKKQKKSPLSPLNNDNPIP